MKKFSVITFIFLFSLLAIRSQNIDTLRQVAITCAANNDIDGLRSVLPKVRTRLPHHFLLYCDMVMARYEGEYEKMIDCIDSLYKWYPKETSLKTRFALAEIKADGLRNLGKYEDMYVHCRNEIKYFKRYGYSKSGLTELELLLQHASKLKGNDLQALLLRCLDRKQIRQMDSLLRGHQDAVDPAIRLRCELLMALTFHDTNQFLATSRELIDNYAYSLSEQELTDCMNGYVRQLIAYGKWRELLLSTERWKISGIRHHAPLDTYQRWAHAYLKYPHSSTVLDTEVCYLPTTYEWPILSYGQLNRGNTICLEWSAEQPYTLIGEEAAVSNQVQILPDTLQLPTGKGILSVSPAYIKDLSMGPLHFQDFFAYVVHHSNRHFQSAAGVLGLNQILTLGKVTFQPEQIQLTREDILHPVSRPSLDTPSLRISEQGELQVTDWQKASAPTYHINWAYPNDLLFKKTGKNEDEDLPQIAIGPNNYIIPYPKTLNCKNTISEGVLGVPFLRSHQSVSFDFNRMQLQIEGKATYQPQRGVFGYHSDLHYLVRNFHALTAQGTIDAQEKTFLQLLIAAGKNRPEEVAAYSASLRSQESDFYNPLTEAEALILLGKYNKAAEIIELVLKDSFFYTCADEKEKAELNKWLQLTQGFRNMPPIAIKGNADDATFLLTKDLLPTVKIHKKKVKVQFDLFAEHTEISSKYSKKFKVIHTGSGPSYDYGIIPNIYVGDLVLQNVPCRILRDKATAAQRLPDQGKGILIGRDVLRHFHQITFTKESIRLSLKEIVSTAGGANLYLDKNWQVETATQGGFRTITLTEREKNQGWAQPLSLSGTTIPAVDTTCAIPGHDSVGGNLQFSQLESITTEITFDWKAMKLILKSGNNCSEKSDRY